ncbi:MAG: (2Fe-2S)-binding protein [Immundisolibacter sp.]|uniref:(2Fe-2S)-binding protein n=1 Tax=Immundisolibacter sp. TaxID=1934948 RepID=UPI00356824A2
MAEQTVTLALHINGAPWQGEVLGNRLLVDFLRYDVGLTGTKEGCGVGVCGACTVRLDGRLVSSCLTLAAMADGCELTTVEGLAGREELKPIQNAFIEHGGFQCGICTPGQLMAASALLEENPHPDQAAIKAWMMSNLCRCTGYYGIVRSIEAAAAGDQA